MQKRELSLPQIFFVVATRALLAGGVSLMLADHLTRQSRRRLGMAMLAIGLITTPPAAMLVFKNRKQVEDATPEL